MQGEKTSRKRNKRHGLSQTERFNLRLDLHDRALLDDLAARLDAPRATVIKRALALLDVSTRPRSGPRVATLGV